MALKNIGMHFTCKYIYICMCSGVHVHVARMDIHVLHLNGCTHVHVGKTDEPNHCSHCGVTCTMYISVFCVVSQVSQLNLCSYAHSRAGFGIRFSESEFCH